MVKAQVSLPKWAAEHLEILKSELESERGSPVSYGVAIGEALKVYRRERAGRNPNPVQPEPVMTNAAQTISIDYSNYDDTTDYGPPEAESDDDDDDDSPF